MKQGASKKSLFLGILVILIWQGSLMTWPKNISTEYTLEASTGLVQGTKGLVPFYHYLDLFPIATEQKEMPASKQDAENIIKENPGSLLMDSARAVRTGDLAKIFLFQPDLWLGGAPANASITPFTKIFFLAALCALFCAFWRANLVLFGGLLVYLLGSNSFLTYEAYVNHNIFSLPGTFAIIMIALHLPLLRNLRLPFGSAILVALIFGVMAGFFKEVRTESVLSIASVFLLYFFNRQLRYPKRFAVIAVLLISYFSTNHGIKSYFDYKFNESYELLEKVGGHPYKGPRLVNHDMWHPLFIGLGDFDKKYGFKWFDGAAADYAYPIMAKIKGLDTPKMTNWAGAKTFYDSGKKYRKRIYEMPEYSKVLKDKVLKTIKDDPIWYAEIIFNRVERLLNRSSAFFPLNGIFKFGIVVPLSVSIVLIFFLLATRQYFFVRLILFPAPLALTPLLFYSDQGTTYYLFSNIVGLGCLGMVSFEYFKKANGMDDRMKNLLAKFPKDRPPLPPALKAIYAEYLKINRSGQSNATSLAVKLESWMHKKVGEDIAQGDYTGETLDVGAGTLIQMGYEPVGRGYDIVEPLESLYEDSKYKESVRTIFDDIGDIPEGQRYDRITSVAVLEHICDLPELIAQCGLHLKEGGVLRVAIPTEGSPLWGLAWRCTTGLEFLIKYRQNYRHLNRHEHVNDWWEIRDLLLYFFSEVKIDQNMPLVSLSFYMFLECKMPNIDRCQRALGAKRHKV
jgi:SAM-dependent methyltransferase